jgi:anion-transporting  ArsA/GET3 family ATPase
MVTGKGGVGKTTLTASIARRLSWTGKRVLVAEVASESGEPSPVAAALGARGSSEIPVDIAPGLRAVQLTPSIGHLRFLQDTLHMRLLVDAAMRSSAIRRFLTAAPAFAELGVLYRMLDLMRQRRPDGSLEHELVVVDTPATGHALAITQLPEVLLKLIPGGPIGSAVREGLSLLQDPSHTGTLVVTLPETLPVSETLELVAGFRKHAVPLIGVVANRMPTDPFTADEREHVQQILETEGPLLGTRAMKRLDRAHAALARLRAGVNLPVTLVPELDEAGPALTEAIAESWRDPEARQEATS